MHFFLLRCQCVHTYPSVLIILNNSSAMCLRLTLFNAAINRSKPPWPKWTISAQKRWACSAGVGSFCIKYQCQGAGDYCMDLWDHTKSPTKSSRRQGFIRGLWTKLYTSQWTKPLRPTSMKYVSIRSMSNRRWPDAVVVGVSSRQMKASCVKKL